MPYLAYWLTTVDVGSYHWGCLGLLWFRPPECTSNYLDLHKQNNASVIKETPWKKNWCGVPLKKNCVWAYESLSLFYPTQIRCSERKHFHMHIQAFMWPKPGHPDLLAAEKNNCVYESVSAALSLLDKNPKKYPIFVSSQIFLRKMCQSMWFGQYYVYVYGGSFFVIWNFTK